MLGERSPFGFLTVWLERCLIRTFHGIATLSRKASRLKSRIFALSAGRKVVRRRKIGGKGVNR
jgi:hypothetical protein